MASGPSTGASRVATTTGRLYRLGLCERSTCPIRALCRARPLPVMWSESSSISTHFASSLPLPPMPGCRGTACVPSWFSRAIEMKGYGKPYPYNQGGRAGGQFSKVKSYPTLASMRRWGPRRRGMRAATGAPLQRDFARHEKGCYSRRTKNLLIGAAFDPCFQHAVTLAQL